MTDGQKNRLLSTLAAIEQVRGQATRAVRDGQSPAQSGRALTPLPDAACGEIEAGLARIAAEARSVAEQFAGDALREREAREPTSATLYWLAFLLRRLDEEVVADLSPDQMAKFGALAPDSRAILDEATGRMRTEIAALQSRVQALRRER